MAAPPTTVPPPDPEAIRSFIDAAAPLLGLTLQPDWRDGTAANLATLAAAAGLVLAFPLDDEVDAAPVFRA